MPKHTHVHKYQLTRYGPNNVFKCMLPNCPHFLPTMELAIGRACECWGCGETLILDRRHLVIKRPTCQQCIEKKKQTRIVELDDDFVKELLKGN